MSENKLNITDLDTLTTLSDEELEQIRGGYSVLSSAGFLMINPQPLPPRFFNSIAFRGIVIGS